MTVAIYIVFVLIVAFFAAIVATMFRKKIFFSKKNAFLFFPLLAFGIALYSIGYVYAKSSYDPISFFECIASALKAFKFEITRDYVQLLLGANAVYAVAFYLTVVLCGLTTITTILGFCEIFLVNAKRLFTRIYHRSPDLVLGTSPQAVTFAAKNKNAVLLIDAADKSALTADMRKALYEKGIAFLKVPFTTQRMEKLFSYTCGKVHVFSFENSVERISAVSEWIRSIRVAEGREIEYHLNVSEANILYVNKRLAEACSEAGGKVSLASCFNLYRTIGQKFSQQYNFAEFLPSSFLKEGTLLPDKTVHAVFLGAGKTNTAIMESTVVNNQFATIEKGKYTIKPIAYHIYDKDGESFDSKILHALNQKRTDGLAAITMTEELNLKSGFTLGKTVRESVLPKPDENNFVYYFVNVGDSLDILTLVNSLTEQISCTNAVIFYNVDSRSEVVDFSTQIPVLPYGFKNEILTKANIVEAELFEKAVKTNELYAARKAAGEPFTTLNIIEKLSNLYANVNVEFKLNTLGLTADPNKGSAKVTEEEFKAIYFGGKEDSVKEYADYFKLCPNNAIRYQEHARWWTYYYINDFRPMPLDEIVCDPKTKKILHKDLTNKLHACLVSYYDLDLVHHHEAELLVRANRDSNTPLSEKDALLSVETYKYDSQILDSIIDDQPIYRLKRREAAR